jgi:hypothetical protein
MKGERRFRISDLKFEIADEAQWNRGCD